MRPQADRREVTVRIDKKRYAVLLLAYGGPDSLSDVEPYLLDIRGGRPTPPELVEEIRERYRRIGGRSPLLERTREQAEALCRRLSRDTDDVGVYVGMRHWHPYISETVDRIVSDGYRTVVSLCLAPHYSRMSIGAYYEKLDTAVEAGGASLQILRVQSWHLHPLFIDALSDRIRAAMRRFAPEELSGLHVLFTAHSLPASIRDAGDPYEAHIQESARAAADRVGGLDWSVCFQSAGAHRGPWIGPHLEDEIPRRARLGVRSLLVVPVGFVSDHVEILYDIDIEAREIAHEHGVCLERTESMNAHPGFIEALAAIVKSRMESAGGS